MEDLKELKVFLIKKFLRTVLVVSVAEYLLVTLLSCTVKPFVMHFFFNDADLEAVSILGIIAVVFIVLMTLIAEVLKVVLPGRAGSFFVDVASNFDFLSRQIVRSDDISIADMGKIKSTILFVILLFCVIVIVIPFFLGALHFARVIIKEFKAIEDAEKEKQREYERKRNLMLSDIAHDLRTPMTTVSGYARAVKGGMVTGEKRDEYLSAIVTKSERMNELINYFFDYVKTDSEGFSLNRKKTDINELVRECAALSYQDAEDKGVDYEADIPEDRCIISADELQLKRVITNLIGNAIKHNEVNGGIKICVAGEDDRVLIMVADKGTVIEEEEAKYIFEPFVMGDKSRGSGGGTGLGLSIAKKITSLHGFDIRLIQQPKIKKYGDVSEYNKAFIIYIPLNNDTNRETLDE